MSTTCLPMRRTLNNSVYTLLPFLSIGGWQKITSFRLIKRSKAGRSLELPALNGATLSPNKFLTFPFGVFRLQINVCTFY